VPSIPVDGFADVVQQAAALGDRVVHAQLHGHQRRELRDLERVHEHVLPVRRAVAETSEELEDLGMEIGEADRERRRLPFLEQLLVELLANLLHQLLDAGRVDAAVLHEALERDAGDLAADGIEAGEDDRFRRVVDDEVDAGRQLERADIAALAADDAALHVLAREVDDGDRILRDVIRGHALDGHAEDLLGLLVAQLGGFTLDALDDVRGFELGLVLHAMDQLALRLLGGEAGDLLELVALRVDELVELALFRVDAFLAVVEGAVALLDLGDAGVDLLGLLVEALFLLLEALLDGFDLVATLLRLLVELRAHLEELFLRLQIGFLDAPRGLLVGVIDDALGAFARLRELRLGALAVHRGPDQGHDDGEGQPHADRDQSLKDVQNVLRVGGSRSEEGFRSTPPEP
jgi:hypothetical protein